MACPAARSSIASAIDRALTALAVGAGLIWAPQCALAQNADPETALKQLIPDAVTLDPETWAKAQPDGSAARQATAPDPTSPLADAPGIDVPWPDGTFAVPSIAPLQPEPGLAGVVEEARSGSRDGTGRDQDLVTVSAQLALAFPADLQAIPERRAIVERFRRLSAIENLRDDKGNVAQIAARARSDKALLVQLLQFYGYYDAQVTQIVAEVPPAKGTTTNAPTVPSVRFDVVPGARYRFGTIDLGHLALAGTDEPALRKDFGINTGDPLYAQSIVDGRARLDVALGDNGYAFARLGEGELVVDHDRETGNLSLPVEPGGRYRFGEVISSDPGYLSGRHLARISRFRSGQIFKRSDTQDLREAVLATGLVSSVTVTPKEVEAPQAGEPGIVAVDVAFKRAPQRTIAGALGYNSSTGLRLEASWEHRNLFPPEGTLRLRGIAGTKEQLAGLTFRRNDFLGRDQALTVDLYADTVNRDAYAARTLAFSTAFEKLSTLIFQKPFTWSAGLLLELTDEREAIVVGSTNPRTTYEIAALPLTAKWDASNSLLDPTRGWRLGLTVSPEYSHSIAASGSYARLQIDASAYQSLGKGVVLAGRVRFGSMPGAQLNVIAPSRRFYAGGGGSVRGFGYQQIGPRDALGQPSGGRSLSEFSLEARFDTGMLGGALQVVPFIDSGAVDEEATPHFHDVRFGTGIGIRYKTSFGPLRIDIGTPLDRRPGESPIAVYVALGQAF